MKTIRSFLGILFLLGIICPTRLCAEAERIVIARDLGSHCLAFRAFERSAGLRQLRVSRVSKRELNYSCFEVLKIIRGEGLEPGAKILVFSNNRKNPEWTFYSHPENVNPWGKDSQGHFPGDASRWLLDLKADARSNTEYDWRLERLTRFPVGKKFFGIRKKGANFKIVKNIHDHEQAQMRSADLKRFIPRLGNTKLKSTLVAGRIRKELTEERQKEHQASRFPHRLDHVERTTK